ncbi:MAG: thiamine pyrophosphate-binding protein [Chloroflexota bacterium]
MAESVRNGAREVVDTLVERGIQHLFGVPGHGAYPIYGALNEVPAIQPVVGRNEQGIGFLADGWSWVTNKVAIGTSVPQAGLTNSSTCILQATLDSERYLFIVEEDPGHRDVLRSTARYYERAGSADQIRPAIHRLMDSLEQGRPAGAALEVPAEILAGPAPGRGLAPPKLARVMPSDRDIGEAASLLSRAQRPVIVAGRPVIASGAEASLRRLAERLKAPVFVHYNGKGALSEDHPLALSHSWSPGTLGDDLLREADVVLAIGPREGPATGGRSADQLASQLIHVDWDDDEQRGGSHRLALAGHVGDILARLADEVKDRATESVSAARLEEIRQGPWRYCDQRVPWAFTFFQELHQGLPRDVLFFTDSMVGLWIFRLLVAYQGRSFRFGFGNGTGTLGYALPAALGAKMAAPEREVVVIAGDGAFMYNPQELATMMRYGLKITAIVCNDNCFGAVRDTTADLFGGSIAHVLANPDFIKLGDAFGMRTERLSSPDQIGRALRDALAQDRSSLIEVPLELRPNRF